MKLAEFELDEKQEELYFQFCERRDLDILLSPFEQMEHLVGTNKTLALTAFKNFLSRIGFIEDAPVVNSESCDADNTAAAADEMDASPAADSEADKIIVNKVKVPVSDSKIPVRIIDSQTQTSLLCSKITTPMQAIYTKRVKGGIQLGLPL
jgi:hypothetical protein